MKRSNLHTYQKKRDFQVTPEPPPDDAVGEREGPPTFMVHKHDARRLHYDLRLEMDGALASWAIPKGPSYDPGVRRLAVQTEDHPLAYGGFEGRIPEGEYGAGDSIIWDRGVYETVPPGAASAMRKKGHLEFVLRGEKLQGRWHLVRTRAQADKAQWILFKAHDGFASTSHDVVAERPESVVSGRRVTRGPTPAAVRQAPGNPMRLLMDLWPPPQPAMVATLPSRETHLLTRRGKGPRALAAVSRGVVALQSDEGRDLAAAHPSLVRALAALPVVEVVLDGTLEDDARLVVWDVPWLDGGDLRPRPLEERLELLGDLVARADGDLLKAAAESRARTGVLARRRGSPYPTGQSRAWAVARSAGKRRA